MVLVRYIASRFLPWRRGSSSKGAHSKLFGAEGERIAERYLRSHGFRILYRNFRSPLGGEIDLVCRDRREACLVFVEVKRRQSNRFGEPSLAIQTTKQHLLVRAASAWLRLLNDPEVSCRFDVIEITGAKNLSIHHIRDAFPIPKTLHGI